MISKIGPLVKVGEQKRLLIFHILGGAVGGVLVGLVLGTFGLVLEQLSPQTAEVGLVIAVPVVLLWAVLADLNVAPPLQPSGGRQTPGYWPCAFGKGPASFAWGFDLAVGFATRIPHQALFALPVAAIFVGDLLIAVVLMGAYGFARSLAVVSAILMSPPQGLAQTCNRILGQKSKVRLAVAAISTYVAFSTLTALFV